jgi:hypothetical protein
MDYIRFIQKRSLERTSLEESRIRKRNHFIESQFVWTQEVYDKLTLVNEKLKHEEKRVFLAYRQIEKNCKLMIKNKVIDDFNIDIECSFFNKNYYKKYEPFIDGNPFFKTTDSFMLFQNKEAEYNTESYYEQHINSLLPGIDHCYSFHSLYDHCHELTWFDIYNIDEVWMEIKIDYQFFSKVKNKK